MGVRDDTKSKEQALKVAMAYFMSMYPHVLEKDISVNLIDEGDGHYAVRFQAGNLDIAILNKPVGTTK